MSLKTLKFNKQEVTFAKWGNEYVIPAKFLGRALGYSKEGEGLTNLLGTTWKKKFVRIDINEAGGQEELNLQTVDALMLKESALDEFKEFSKISGDQSPQLLILTPSGLIKVLTRSRSKMAAEFRNFLSRSGRELLGNRTLKAKGLGKAFKKGANVPDQKSMALNNALNQVMGIKQSVKREQTMNELLQLTKELKKSGLISKKEHKDILSKMLEVKMVKFSKENGVQHFLNPDGTVTPANTAALARSAVAVPEGNFNLATRDEQFHPDFMNWMPASEIGRPFGLKGDLVKKYVKRICDLAGVDLPNNDAKRAVELNNGKFPSTDDKGFITYHPEHGLGFAMIMKMEGNQLNWRNYWSPAVVDQVRRTIEAEMSTVKNGSTNHSEPVQVGAIIKAEQVTDAEIVPNG